MNILHLAAHMGDGAGKAIGGLAVLGNKSGKDIHRVLLLDEPRKTNHIDRCCAVGVEVLPRDAAEFAINEADVIVLSWWGSSSMDTFLREFPNIPCRVMLWTHKNGFYDPPLSDALVRSCDKLLVTSPLTLENPAWSDGTLVYGFGDFAPEKIPPKTDYSLNSDSFVIGYVGMPSYKRFPQNALDYMSKTISLIPDTVFVLAGEYSDEFKSDITLAGLADKVQLLGWTNDVLALLRTFDVFGYLLRSDSSATTENSVLEAMAAGLPVVMARKPVGKYLVRDGVGFLADSPEEYAKNMLRIYESEDLRRTVGQAARKHIFTSCNASENLNYFQEACLKVIAKQKNIHKFGGF